MSPSESVIPLSDLNLAKLEIHGICMSLCFGLFLPSAAIIARYYKGVGSSRIWWFRVHLLLIFLGLIFLFVGMGFVVSVVGLTGSRFAGQSNTRAPIHSLVGFGLLLAIAAQIALGMAAQKSYDEEAKQESNVDNVHSLLGKALLLLGAVNIALGLYHLKNVFLLPISTPFISIFLGVWIAVSLFLAITVAVLEFSVGRGSRYYSGNIFAVAKSLGGAKAMFDMTSFQRNMAIKRASIDLDIVSQDDNVAAKTKTNLAEIEDSVSLVLSSAPREKEGNLSPFLYRPTWDAGLKKATPIHQIAAVEQHMIREDSKTDKSSPSDLLSRLRGAEIPPVRSRSNSVTKAPVSFIMTENSRSSITAAEQLQAEVIGGPRSRHQSISPGTNTMMSSSARPRARSFSSRPSSMHSRPAFLSRDSSGGIGFENSFNTNNDHSTNAIPTTVSNPPHVDPLSTVPASNHPSLSAADSIAASQSLPAGALEKLSNKLQKSTFSGKKMTSNDA